MPGNVCNNEKTSASTGEKSRRYPVGTTRQHYVQLYQAIKYLSLDIAEFIEKGPQMTGLARV